MGSPLCVSIFLVLSIFIQSSVHGQSLRLEPFGSSQAVETKKTFQDTKTRFLLFEGENDQGCQIRLHHPDTLQQCGFNSSLPLVMIIHGWSVDGLLEKWIWQMVAALKSQLAQPVNVGLANWITLAQNHYTVAVRNTRLVGQEVAALLRWLEESVPFSRSNVHLIGYSLGAHVSGFAGSYIGGKHKIGRITGLDAAGPLFEGSPPSDRLSPDDANFVDAIHTFTRGHMGLSVGIKEPIAHYDFYPNGGSFQPGCHFLELYRHITKHGLNAITQTIKCSHERSVHLFIDSLLHTSMQSTAYLCSNMNSFSQGLCLSCKKGHCNTLGYHIRQEWHGKKSRRLFLVTRAQSPFRVQGLAGQDKHRLPAVVSQKMTSLALIPLAPRYVDKAIKGSIFYNRLPELRCLKDIYPLIYERGPLPDTWNNPTGLHLRMVYHYQFKMQFFNQIEKPVETTFTMSLLGTKEEMQKIPITLSEGIISNKTYSFLITLDMDIGELVMITLKQENSAVWTNVWNTVQTIIPWGREPLNSGLVLKNIRVKAGEIQQRITFCSENMDDPQLHPTQEKIFVRCDRNSKKLKQKTE